MTHKAAMRGIKRKKPVPWLVIQLRKPAGWLTQSTTMITRLFPDEFGDLLLQVICQCRIAEEASMFTYEDVARLILQRLMQSCPDMPRQIESPVDRSEDQEAAEHRVCAKIAGVNDGTLAGLPINVPALTRAYKLTVHAARFGFDWRSIMQVVEKPHEEFDELREELVRAETSLMEDELGDILFTVANLARKLRLDPKRYLRQANGKFERRFNSMERKAGMSLHEKTLEQMEALWQQAKREV